MKLSATEKLVVDWYIYMKRTKEEIKKLVNRFKLKRLMRG